MCHINCLIFWRNLFLVASLYFKSVFTHVSLTFPPARSYDLDFLDNIRTKPPCGMPRGIHGTTLMAGVQHNISWHLAYPHRGGYRLELLDKNDNFVMDLIKRDKSQGYIQGDPTAQWHTVTIPQDLLCDTCTIRLLRQASEWANEYRFWSCADVRIVQPSSYIEDCSRHGQVILVGGGDGCKCYKGWWGPRCQYEEECHSNVDCGKGTCVDLGGTALPRKQCFCPPGVHGLKCSRTNTAKLATKATLDLSSHTKNKLSDKMSLYYKIIPGPKPVDNEIEFVLMINGTSYGALGWRPVSLNKSCKLWPRIEENKHLRRVIRQSSREKPVYRPNPTLLRPLNDLQRSRDDPDRGAGKKQKQESTNYYSNSRNEGPSSLPEAEPQAEPETEPENAVKINEVKFKSGTVRNSGSRLPKPEPTPETEPESEPESEPEVGSKGYGIYSKSGTERSKGQSQTRSRVTPEAEPETEPESEPESEPKSKYGTPVPKSFFKGHPVPEPESEPETARRNYHKSSPEPEPEGNKKHHNGVAEPEPEGQKGHHYGVSEPDPEGYKQHHTKSSPEPEPEGHKIYHTGVSEPEPEGHKLKDHHKTSPEPEPESHKGHHTGSPEPEPEGYKNHHDGVSEPEPESHHGVAEPESEPETSSSASSKESRKSQYAPKGDFHGMDCTDIIIGSVRNGVYSRILDYYTRDRSTPRLDEFWGQSQGQGSNSITSATGWQTGDGKTVLIFRRKIKSTDPTDHDIEGGMHVIWARGQERGGYVHSPHSGLEKESPSIPNFYEEDEIKYHGHKDQRGSTFIQF